MTEVESIIIVTAPRKKTFYETNHLLLVYWQDKEMVSPDTFPFFGKKKANKTPNLIVYLNLIDVFSQFNSASCLVFHRNSCPHLHTHANQTSA